MKVPPRNLPLAKAARWQLLLGCLIAFTAQHAFALEMLESRLTLHEGLDPVQDFSQPCKNDLGADPAPPTVVCHTCIVTKDMKTGAEFPTTLPMYPCDTDTSAYTNEFSACIWLAIGPLEVGMAQAKGYIYLQEYLSYPTMVKIRVTSSGLSALMAVDQYMPVCGIYSPCPLQGEPTGLPYRFDFDIPLTRHMMTGSDVKVEISIVDVDVTGLVVGEETGRRMCYYFTIPRCYLIREQPYPSV